MTDYAGFAVWEIVPRERITVEIGSPWLWNGDPWQRQEKVVNEPVQRVVDLRLIQTSPAERRAVRDFFDARRGRFEPFWMPSHKRDLIVSRPAGSATTTLYVENHAEVFGLYGLARHVYQRATGQRFKIAGPAQQPEGDVALTISPALTESLAPGDALEWLLLVRFGEDAMKIAASGFNDVLTEAGFSLKELQPETP